MILQDIAARIREMPDPDHTTEVSRRMLEEIIAELRAGKEAQDAIAHIDAHIAKTFGLRGGPSA